MPQDNTTQVIYDDQQPALLLNAAELCVIHGPDVGARCSVELERVRVGTDADNDLVLADPQVSRHHLELQVQDQGYLLTDLRSTNGTRYRGARIREALLAVGAEISLGATVLQVKAAGQRRREAAPAEGFGEMIGTSPPMQRLYGLLRTVAPSDVTVLIGGETGSGKELVAEALHRRSPRRDSMFCVVDCGALTPQLVESELFGHERGAFTSAVGERKGVFERAHGGTIFLDEIGEIPLELQTRLLRVLDRRTVKRVGGAVDQRVDVRVIAATNRDLAEEVRRGAFRSDLFYRLAVVQLQVPPLRERREDILPLARHFLWEAGICDPEAVLTPDVVQSLTRRDWPGNVRELRNALLRAAVLSDGPAALLEPAPLELPSAAASAPPPPPPQAGGDPGDDWLAAALPLALLEAPYKRAKETIVEDFDRLYIDHLVERHGDNISRMARDAGVDRQLIRKLQQKQKRGR